MTNFVLIHGAWHGGWCWSRVRDKLSGHNVLTPTLKGLAERADELTDDLDLQVHVDEIVDLFVSNDLRDVTLCGHSYAGAVITQVADLIPERIRAVVYLDAYVPCSGESVISLTEGWVMDDSPTLAIPPASFFGLSGEDAAYVDSLLTLHPAAASLQPLTLTTDEPAGLIARKTYVLATEWEGPTHFHHMYEKYKEDPAWKVEVIAGSHNLMLDRTDDVVRILLEAADEPEQGNHLTNSRAAQLAP